MVTEPDSLSDGGDDAQGNEGGQDLSGDQAQDGGQGKGGKNRAGKNRTLAGDREKTTLAKSIVDLIVNYRAPKDLKRRINPKFKRIVAKKRELYGSDALDALHDLAMMPITDNALLNQIKLQAAQRLAGKEAEATSAPPSEVDHALRQLNAQFHKTAPRIKSVRERIVEFDQPMQAINGT